MIVHAAIVLVRHPMSNRELWGLTLLERILAELNLLGIREVSVISRPELSPEEHFRRHLPTKLTVRFQETEGSHLYGALATELREADGSVLVLEGHALNDRRILKMLLDSPAPRAVVSPTGLNRAGAAVLSSSEASLFDGKQEDLTSILSGALESSSVDALDLSDFVRHVVNLRREIDPYLLLVENTEQLGEADRTLRSTVHKGVNDFVAKYIHPPLEFGAVRLLIHTPITPNLITFLWIGLAALVVPLFAGGELLLGLFLAAACGILDGIDGKLARLTLRFSKFGDRLDHVSNTLYDALWYLALGWHFAAGRVNSTGGLFASILLAAYVVERIVPGVFKRIHGVEIYDYRDLDKKVRLLGSRMNNNVWFMMLSTIIGMSRQAFYAVSLWMLATAAFHTWRLVWVTWKDKSGLAALPPKP